MKSFCDRVVVITGAASGIGRQLALQLAHDGARLELSDKAVDGLAGTAEACRAAGAGVTTAAVDVSDREAVFAWARAIHQRHGRVDVLFNNAGVALGSTVEGMSDEDLDWVMSVNFWGVVHGSRAFLPYLRDSADGRLVNISSAFGLVAMPGQGGYNASKFAIRGFTEALSLELELGGSPLIASCVFPGGIKSNIARSARIRDNLTSLTHMEPEQALNQFESRLITDCEVAARQILDGVRRGRRRIVVGPDARALDLLARWLPSLYRKFVLRAFSRQARIADADAGAIKQERPLH